MVMNLAINLQFDLHFDVPSAVLFSKRQHRVKHDCNQQDDGSDIPSANVVELQVLP